MSDGRPEWTNDNNLELKKTTRFWPHKIKGEGHFVAKIVKLSGEEFKGKKLRSHWKPFNEINEKIKIFIQNFHNSICLKNILTLMMLNVFS